MRRNVKIPACYQDTVNEFKVCFRKLRMMRQGNGDAAGGMDSVAVILAHGVPGLFAVTARILGVEGDGNAGAYHSGALCRGFYPDSSACLGGVPIL